MSCTIFVLALMLICCFFLKGLRIGDEVIEFGSVNASNFKNLQNIASVVQHSEGVRHCHISSGSAIKLILLVIIWHLNRVLAMIFLSHSCLRCLNLNKKRIKCNTRLWIDFFQLNSIPFILVI